MTLPGNGYLEVPWEGYQTLNQEGLLHIRVRGASILKPWNFEEDFSRIKELKKEYNNDMVSLTAAKVFTDGIMASESAYLLQPYNNTADHYGEAIWTQEALNNAYATVNKEGIQVHTHSIGDAAVRMALDAAEYTKSNTPGSDVRNTITHLQLVDADDFPRFKEFDVIPVVQPFWHFKQPGAWEPIEHPVLGERAETEWPLKSFVDNGAIPVFSSDYPVTNVPSPFYAIEIAITRNLPDGPAYGVPDDITDIDDPTYLLGPGERLDIKSAIRGYTANAAYSIFAEDIVGTLEVGKSADVIVIDQDLFVIDPLKISETQVLKTYVNGKLVYSQSNS
jgi:predicted amidohydrolase YtcJ